MNANPLEPVWKAYNISVKCFDMTYDIIKQKNTSLLTNSDWLLVPNIHQDIVQTRQESNDLFIVRLWATFEGFVISYLQDKDILLRLGTENKIMQRGALQKGIPSLRLGTRETDDILNLLKEFSSINENLIEQAKTIFQYKTWIADGKDINKVSAICAVSTTDSYRILNEIVSILLLN